MTISTAVSIPLSRQYSDIFADQSGRRNAVLGLGAYGHDAAAALVSADTGEVLFAVSEERLTNVKHDWHFPIGAIHACCQAAQKHGVRIASVAVNFRPEEFLTKTLFMEIDRGVADANSAAALKASILALFPTNNYFSLVGSNPTSEAVLDLLARSSIPDEEASILCKRLTWYFNWAVKYQKIRDTIIEHFPDVEVHFCNHHTAHAASAYFNSGFDEATVLVIDGSGEADTVTVYRGSNGHVERVSQTNWPHSLGIFYYFATNHLGFELGDEYKIMGMAAYGSPKYFPQLREMFHVSEDANLLQIETKYLARKSLMAGCGHIVFGFTEAMNSLVQVRKRNDPILQQHFDFAASVQKITQEVGIVLAQKAMKLTGLPNLAIAGGVALNGLMNEEIRRMSGCRDLFIYPAAGDDGCSVGAAQWQVSKHHPIRPARVATCFFGTDVSEPAEILAAIDKLGLTYTQPSSIHGEIAGALAAGKIVARCHGRSEFGPRALGNRSILANPSYAGMKEILNARVKHREEFRPFAPACLAEKVKEYFDLDVESPFMLLIGKATELAHHKAPATVHVDGTARLQTVNRHHNPEFHATISAFEALTGLPIVLNTSFNVSGETIVETALDALESFGFMDIDYLAIGPYWISKASNRERFPTLEHEEYLERRKMRHGARNLGPLKELDISQFDPAFQCEEQMLERFVSTVSVVGAFLRLETGNQEVAHRAIERFARFQLPTK